MKILKITFQNLNSLKGEHSIDLENGLLSEAGIFSITGPTGAGKSTILDAITLALFGKAARYEKEANPGEMMTRGTGECAAEVLFECSKGRYTAKWTRARSRKKPDGKLQGSKREVAKADTGEILAEKLKEADTLVESLTGLDYHRFLRSVLLAQGRFKEFLDADDNERGDLLEKITGTEIYSRISKKAYQIEVEHKEAIHTANLRLDGVELKSNEALTALKEEQASKATEIATFKAQLKALQDQLQRFDTHQQLTRTLEQSNQAWLGWQTANAEFAPSRELLARHEATQPFQADLIELNTHTRQLDSLAQELSTLTQTAQQQQVATAQRLTATEQAIRSAIAAKSTEISTLVATQQQATTSEQAISTWLTAHKADSAIEDLLPEVRTAGESVRQSDRDLKSKLTEQATLQQEQQTNEIQLVAKQARVTTSEQTVASAQSAATTAADTFKQAADSKTIEHWRDLAKAHTQTEQAAQTIQTQRNNWQQATAALAQQTKAQPALLQQLTAATQALKTRSAAVEQATAVLEDKQTIYGQARLIAKLESHRAELKPNESCPLCGSTEHPYADHLESNEDADKLAVAAQKQLLAKAETAQQAANETYNRLDERSNVLKQAIADATDALSQQAETLAAQARTAGYSKSIEDDDAFAAWLTQLQSQRSTTETKLAQIEQFDRAQRKAADTHSTLAAEHKVSITQLQGTQQTKSELATKLATCQQAHTAINQQIEIQLAAFNQQVTEHLQPALQPAETVAHTKTLEGKLAEYQQQIDAQQKLQLRFKELTAQHTDLTQAHTRLTEEQTHWQQELTTFAGAESATVAPAIQIATSETQRRSDCQAALDAARQAAQSVTQKQKDSTIATQRIQAITTALQDQLQDSSVESIEALKAARLSDAALTQLHEEKSKLQTQHDTLQGQIKQTHEALEKLTTAGICSPEEAATLRTQQTAQDEQIGSHNKRLGEIATLLKLDAEARSSQAQLIAKIEALQAEARPWIELNALIGSASGDKFSKFAQGLTLAQLLQLANKHLLELNDRYVIQRTPESELSLQIIDRYQADAIRPTRSLSGGESFLVSLALALGLSDLAGSDTKIESLFIDEGFGTLDTDTLDTALAALENLRMSNRTIGIISHVDALKQRISAQIRVEKASNGYGTLAIINGI
ncbi:MAG: exonuclease SbcC [Lentimonas sp.]|jgi:exonuclease SbcC